MEGRCLQSAYVRYLQAIAAVGLYAIAGVPLAGCGSPSSESTGSAVAPMMVQPPVRVIRRIGSDSTDSGMADLKPVHWRLSGLPRVHRVKIFSAQGFCDGEPAPKFEVVRVSERGKDIYLTPYVRKRHPTGVICRGLGGSQWGVVELRQGGRDVRLYDATTSPPSLRWPR